MSNVFLCPKCKGCLNFDDNIIFSVKNIQGNKGLLLLSSELGNYKVLNKLPFRFEVGDKFSFFCPICHEELDCERDGNLVKVLMQDDEGHEFEVCFSRIAGEQSTYKILGKIVETYGDDAEKYKDLF